MLRGKMVKVLPIAAAFLTAIFLAVFMLQMPLQRASAETGNEKASAVGVYQGEGNWYYFSGDFSENRLINMFYVQQHRFWQGQGELNRIYIDNLAQCPTAEYDAIRAYAVSKDGKLNIVGEVSAFTNDDTGDEVCVSIMLAEQGETEGAVVLLEQTVLHRGDAPIDLSQIDTLQGISVGIGDVLFFVAEVSSQDSICGGVFDVDFSLRDVTDQAAPAAPVAESISLTGDFAFTYDNSGNVLKDSKELITTSMHTDNQSGNQYYVYQAVGMQTLTPMDFAGYESPGSWYTMPNSFSSVGAVWFNKWYSNSTGGFGDSGLCYNVPADGKLSVVGAYARSDVSEMGDDGSLETESAFWRIIRIRGGVLEELVGQQPILKNTIGYFADTQGTQEIEVLAGDQICVQYLCSAAWKTSCMSILFDYAADPIDQNMGWAVSGDIPQETYDSIYGTVQGENNWYYAFGASDAEYYELDCKDGVWEGEDVYSSVSVDHRIMAPSNSSSVMKVWKAVGEGTARIVGNMVTVKVDATGMTFRVSKRAYSENGWGAAEVLYSQGLNSKKTFAEFNLENVQIKNGDIVFFEVLSENDALTAECSLQLELNCYVDFRIDTPAQEVGEGIGAEEYSFTSDWYSDVQGKNGWFYAYGDKDNYVLMNYGFGNVNYALWNGPEWNTSIDATAQYLGAYTGTMRIYVADRDGVLRVLGSAAVVSTDGEEGINARIYHNGETVWSQEYSKDDRTARTVELTLEVNKGDTVMFYAENKAGNTVAYSSKFFYNVSISLTSESTDIVPETELYQYLDAKDSYKAFLGLPDEKKEILTVSETDSGCNGVLYSESAVFAAICIGLVCTVSLWKRREKK